jgi:hypothetical protein
MRFRRHVFALLNIKVVLILIFNWVKVLGNKAKRATSIIVLASLFVVFAMLLAINQIVNVTLYDYGLQYSLNWSNPYVLYLDLALLLIIIDVFLVGIVQTGIVEISIEEMADPELESEEPERKSLPGRSAPVVSTPRVAPAPATAEEKKATSPKPFGSVPLNEEAQKRAVIMKPVTKQPGKEKPSDAGLKPMIYPGYCTSCGTRSKIGARYCKICGNKLE